LTFAEFNLDERLIEGIEALGFEQPSPIQAKAIPIILKGKDLIASAQTGTGKTAAFLLPMIQKIITSKQHNKIKALIVVPTRELAIQIDQMLEGISYFTPISSVAVYGGSDGAMFQREKNALVNGADVVISTPGRLKMHLGMEYVDFSSLEFLVLDEGDRMLDMGFYDDIVKITSFLPKQRQNLLFSATMPKKIKDLAHKILNKPEEISISISQPAEKIKHSAFIVFDYQKIKLASYLLSDLDFRSILVFCSTKVNTKQLARELKAKKFSVEEFHSDLEQNTRAEVLSAFKARNLKILVATDIMSRGIDIEDIDMVINYDVPHDGEDYIHRIGRTARAASEGVAYTFVSEKEQDKFQKIERLLGKEIIKEKLPDFLGDAPEYKPGHHSHKGGNKKPFNRNPRNFHKKKSSGSR
jgi:ATP-dependent RNA helicase RhlE